MSTNLIRRNQGDNIWAGYACYKTLFDKDGIIHEGGGKYVIFKDGWLVAEEHDPTKAHQLFKDAVTCTGIRLSEYKGIDARLRGGVI